MTYRVEEKPIVSSDDFQNNFPHGSTTTGKGNYPSDISAISCLRSCIVLALSIGSNRYDASSVLPWNGNDTAIVPPAAKVAALEVVPHESDTSSTHYEVDALEAKQSPQLFRHGEQTGAIFVLDALYTQTFFMLFIAKSECFFTLST